MNPFLTLGAREIAARVRSGEVRASDVVQAHLDWLSTAEPHLHAMLHVDAAGALERAENLKLGGSLPLAGVPVIIKDNIQVAGLPLTCASRILDQYRSTYNATCVQKLLDAGAIVLGKANLDEFAMGSSCEHSAFGPTHNPWDLSRVPGGSSGGSAAAVAAHYCPLAIGTDTGGSIRQPAAFTGTVGFKPTYGRISRFGLVAFGSSLDQAGPITRNVSDAQLAYEVMRGPDRCDGTTVDIPEEVNANTNLAGLRVGYVAAHLGEGCDEAVRQRLLAATEKLKAAGAVLVELDMPLSAFVVHVYYVVATSEASTNLSRFDGIRYGLRRGDGSLASLYETSRGEGFGPEVKRRIMLGTFALSSGYQDAYYKRALKVRRKIRHEYERCFGICDVLLSPTAPSTAFAVGANITDPLKMYLNDIFTIGANLSGHPAISLPCGFDGDGLPVGLQLQAARNRDNGLFDIAGKVEALLNIEARLPSICTASLPCATN